MTDIKELALKVGNELSKENKFHWDGSLFVFVEKFFAAYLKEQEAVVVPKESTEAMCQAASARCHHPQALYKAAYKAMIAAGEVKP